MSRNSAITETDALVQTTSGVETSRLEEMSLAVRKSDLKSPAKTVDLCLSKLHNHFCLTILIYMFISNVRIMAI